MGGAATLGAIGCAGWEQGRRAARGVVGRAAAIGCEGRGRRRRPEAMSRRSAAYGVAGTPVPAGARLVAAHEDTVRDVIHRFNEIGPLRRFAMANRTTPTTLSWPATRTTTHVAATPTPAASTSWPANAANAPVSAANANNAGPTHAGPGRLRSARRVEMRRIVRPPANRAVVAVLDHAVGVVPLMIAAVGRPFARNASIDQGPRQVPPKPRPPPTTAQVAHLHKL